MYTSFPSNIFIVPDSSLGRVWGFGVNGPRFKPRWSSFLSILWVFRFHNFMSKMSQESQVNLNFADYDKLGLRLSAISISPQSEEMQVWPVGCPRAGCKIGRRQKWQRRLILKNQTVCNRLGIWECALNRKVKGEFRPKRNRDGKILGGKPFFLQTFPNRYSYNSHTSHFMAQ